MLYNLKNFGNDYKKNNFVIPKHLRKYKMTFQNNDKDKMFYAYNNWQAMKRAEKIAEKHGFGDIDNLFEIDKNTNRIIMAVDKIDKKYLKNITEPQPEPAKRKARLKNDTVFVKGFNLRGNHAPEKKLFKAGTIYEYSRQEAHTWDAGDFILHTAIIRENGVTWEAYEREYI